METSALEYASQWHMGQAKLMHPLLEAAHRGVAQLELGATRLEILGL